MLYSLNVVVKFTVDAFGYTAAILGYILLSSGVGRLIAECRTVPLVLPMWHIGKTECLNSAYNHYHGCNAILYVAVVRGFEWIKCSLRNLFFYSVIQR
jgi:hypothetical protein